MPAARTRDDFPDGAVKHFVLDTNVLLHNPNALFVFQDNHVVIPYPVIEELDSMKRREDDLGRNARECIRHLDRLRDRGSLTDGVNWGLASPTVGQVGSGGPTGTVRIDIKDHSRPGVLHEDSPDNRIIAAAWDLHQQGLRTVFVSKDISARIKSDSLGIHTEDFENQKVDADHLYNGFITLDTDGPTIDELYRDRMLPLERLAESLTATTPDGQSYKREMTPNQFAVLRNKDDENHTGLARRLADTDALIPVTGPRKPVFGIMARNVQQTMALDLLLDDNVKLVSLIGSAGTGKTLLAIAAGMSKTLNEGVYQKLLCARPIMPLGRDIGYRPGDKDEKLTAWMQPIFDNMSYLLSSRPGAESDHKGHSAASLASVEQRIKQLIESSKAVRSCSSP